MTLLVYILAYLTLSTLGLTLLKLSVSTAELSSTASLLRLLGDYKFIIGFVSYVASFSLWLILLSKKDLSYIYPIVVGLSYVIIMITAFLFFRENITMNKALGAVLILLGVVIIYMQK